MKIKFSKKNILYFIIILWLVFSTGYVIWSLWSNFRNIQMFNAYEQGRVDTIDFLVEEAQKCQPVSVFGTEKQIQIISMDCLETAAE